MKCAAPYNSKIGLYRHKCKEPKEVGGEPKEVGGEPKKKRSRALSAALLCMKNAQQGDEVVKEVEDEW